MSGIGEYLSQRLWDESTMIFRGVPDSSYELIPAIGRHKANDAKALADFERKIFEEFKERAVRYMSHEPRGDIEWLFLAQHYGIPTRLLDWTGNPLVALYFACEKNPEHEAAVYKIVMNKEYINFNAIDPFQITEIGLLRPRHTDIRYINQAGVFTIHPNPTEPMSWQGIGKYIFDAKLKDDIRWQLRKLGIHASLIFPGLDSVARDIIHEHEVILNGGFIRTSGNPFEF
jgi:hypothetical protein